MSIYTVITNRAEIKRGSKVTNPNQIVRGGDENYLKVDGYDIEEGRQFSVQGKYQWELRSFVGQ